MLDDNNETKKGAVIHEKNNSLDNGKQSVKKQTQLVVDFMIKLVIVFLSFLLIFSFLFGIDRVEDESMYPRLRDGDLIIYYRLDRKNSIGNVVVVSDKDGKEHIGRIVAKAGDIVDMDDGRLLINGNIQSEEIFYPTYKTESTIDFPLLVAENQLFILCDFRTQGVDSRFFGAIDIENIKGKVIIVIRIRGI